MVRIEENELIIELYTDDPADKLSRMRGSILTLISAAPHIDCDYNYMEDIVELLKAMEPEAEQLNFSTKQH